MREGQPSLTAQRVAGYRLGFDRLAAPYGDPAAEEALTRDVAGESSPGTSEVMRRHLRARTAFFDRVTVNALDRGVTQVVTVGAGYDGRALRYAKPGVRWWEVDHPDTQRDKRARLDRLGIGHDQVTFVAHDLGLEGLATALVAAGLEPDGLSLIGCEGVAVYLSPGTLRSVLADLRSLAAPGTRLAVSVTRQAPTAERQAARAQLRAALAAMGEPAASTFTEAELAGLLDHTRWRLVEISEKAQRAGLLVAAPVWAPATEGPPSRGRLAGFAERMLYRAGAGGLAGHLETTYGVTVHRSRELDLGVHRVELAGGARWIARVFPAARPVAQVRADGGLLAWLGEQGFPAERPACGDPVSVHEGQGVLVTQLAAGRPLGATPESFVRLGRLLGHLHTLPATSPVAGRPGGAWHQLVLDGSPADEIEALGTLVHDARFLVPPAEAERYNALVAAIGELDPCADLPHALVHADLVPGNVVGGPSGEVVVIDWSGAGRGPRVVALGCLLWAAAGTRGGVQAALAGYGESVTLEAEERARLRAATALRPLVLAGWTFATGRDRLAGAVDWWTGQRRALEAVLAQVGL